MLHLIYVLVLLINSVPLSVTQFLYLFFSPAQSKRGGEIIKGVWKEERIKGTPYEKQGKVTLFHVSQEKKRKKKNEWAIYHKHSRWKKGAPVSEESFYKLWYLFSSYKNCTSHIWKWLAMYFHHFYCHVPLTSGELTNPHVTASYFFY